MPDDVPESPEWKIAGCWEENINGCWRVGMGGIDNE